ncbi:hypothetical protein Lepto7375DRAFT_1468 [Leptolyngbya sp. PCC 7375]|nr:hypothetical protein Lepto7375DRAFT_1468 [Leptolyngbya sp. PCC 7375]
MADHYTFLSWVRDGAAAQILQPETLANNLPVRAPLEVTLDIESQPSSTTESVTVHLAVYGPGDVRSLDLDEIVRVDPPPFSNGFEPNYVPVIEFRRADLPWLFSPVAGTANNNQKLRPWLTLVVVPIESAQLQLKTRGQLPQLRCPVQELPDLADSWAWAHAQILNLSPSESIYTILEEEPERCTSRLIGPRRLEAGRSYYACLVPTFKAGVEAALGHEVTTTTLEPAWPSPAKAHPSEMVDLPLYHRWSFTTGESGDFETLVSRLTPHGITSGMAVRQLDVSEPGAGVIVRDDGEPAELLPFAGALAPEGHQEKAWTTAAGKRFAQELRQKFETVAEAKTNVVGAPLYGRWYAGTDRLASEGEAPHWLSDLNLDPRLRAYASLGVQTVQKHQEALMASAWEQLDEVEKANQLLRQAQLARDVADGMMRHRLSKLRDATLMQVTRGAHNQVDYQDTLVSDAVTQSAAPDGIVTSTLRRMTRPRGPLVRRTRHGARLDTYAFVKGTASGTIKIDTRSVVAKGSVPFDDLDAIFTMFLKGSRHTFASQTLQEQKDAYNSIFFKIRFAKWTETAPKSASGSLLTRLKSSIHISRAFNAAIALMERQERLTHSLPDDPTGFPDVADMAEAVKAQLDPNENVEAHIRDRFEAGFDFDARTHVDLLEPILAAPYFRQPMYEVLEDMAPGFLLTGADGLPPESISLVETNGSFIYAYMIGLNHGMANELLWRGFPTDQRGTYFRSFWDYAGQNGQSVSGQPSDDEGPVDIEPLHKLPPQLRLLDGNPNAATNYLTLVLRGEFLHRFPNAWLAAQPAVFKPLPKGRRKRQLSTEQPKMPIFSGRLGDDAAFFAFDLTLAEARGDSQNPGWYIVFREPPTEVRFGLDVPAGNDTVPKSLDNLAWNHVMDVSQGDRYANTLHSQLTAKSTFTERVDPQSSQAAPVTWAANGAHMARCLMQWPVSVAFHAEALLPSP